MHDDVLCPREIAEVKQRLREGQSTHPVNYDCYIAQAQIDKLIALGWKSPKEINEYISYALDIENPCPSCNGWGKRNYPTTSTWMGGIGGASITPGVCDKCWGSGDADKPWINLRVLRSILTPEQISKLRGKC